MGVGTAIRDAIFDRLEDRAGYAVTRKWPRPILQPDQLPSLTVSLLREGKRPEGDDNIGEPRFEVESTIGISMVRGFEKPELLEPLMHAEADAIEDLLLADPTFVHFREDALFEGVSEITRTRTFPLEGQTYFCEMRMEFTFRSRISFPPRVDDDYLGMKITARPAGHDADTPKIELKIDAPTD